MTISPPPSGNDNVGAGGRLTAEGMEVESFNLSGSVAREYQYQLVCADTFTPAPPVEPRVFTKTQTSAPGQRSDDLLSCPEGQVIDVNTTAPFGAFGFRNLTPTPTQGELDQGQVSRVPGDGPDGLSPTTVRAILVVSASSTRTFSWQAFVRCTAAA